MLSIRLIGPVELSPNAAGALSRGAREVLAYLALNGRTGRGSLAAAIWPESDEGPARYNLRRALTDLRRALGPEAERLESEGTVVALDLEGADVDLFHVRKGNAAGSETPLEDLTSDWARAARTAIRAELAQDLPPAVRRERGEARALASPPAALGAFVGREETLADLANDLQDHRLVTLCGVGGLGKTRTASALLERMASRFPDGAAFVELTGAPTAAAMREAVARALGLREGGAWPQALEWLARRRTLLLLDNAEHALGAAAEVVTELLARAPSLRLVVTSRVPLGLPTERRRRLPPLSPVETRALFAARAAAADPDYAWSAEADRLCERLDGIPLAVELTAAMAGSVPLASLTDALTLDSEGQGRPERHRTMRAALQASLATLPEPRRRAFARLGAFVEGFTGAAATAVAGVDAAELARLALASLVEFDGARYRMLEPVRQLAAEELAANGEETAVRDRHAAWFSREASAAYDGPFPYNLDPKGFDAVRARLLRDAANLRAARAWLDAQGRGESDEALAIWLTQVWHRLIQPSDPEAQAWLPRLEASEVPASDVAAHWWLCVATYTIWNDGRARGKALLRRLATAAEARGQRDVFAHAALGLQEEPLADGRIGYEAAIQAYDDLGWPGEARHARIQRAYDLSDGEAARGLAAEALAHHEVRNAALALRLVARGETDWPRRQGLLREALRLQRAAGHWAEIHTLRALATAAHEMASPQEEIEAWEEAIRRGEEVGHLGDLAELRLGLARAFLRDGQESPMWQALAQALPSIRALKRPEYLHLALAHVADLVRLTGEPETYRELVGYLHREAAHRGFELHEKFVELRCDVAAADDSLVAPRFAQADEIIEWVEVRAALGNPLGELATAT